MTHTAEAFIVSCMDLRFQKYVEDFAREHAGEGKYDRIAFAGGIKDIDIIMEQLDISVRLHHTNTAIFINHEDCGAYGAAGTPEKHRQDLQAAKQTAAEKYPQLHIDLYYLHLDGIFEKIT